MKRCIRCGALKALDQFRRNSPSPDGRRGTCRDCEGAPPNNGQRVYQATWRDDVASCPSLAPPPVVLPNGEVIA